ncbi:AHS2-domain-containing protein [Polyplosphaeria fusca]|uniref:AHS2-domain-containing protein n=1 Tax=Polyplosphaeria fusca TaxID=682080 RepID=A0A9P4UZJ7_9PLEO|nr:AHS2-domain-containing protein [Polyplosphaeria fusca]
MDLLKTLLIANRGDIAVRICRTAKTLNIRTIAVYSEADAASQHVRDADEAVVLPGPDETAYSDGEAIIKIAKAHNADAIIPGYGFLSESVDFARLVSEAGMVCVTTTSFLNSFKYTPHAIDVLSADAHTFVQHLPARPTAGKGMPHSGPMDPLAFQMANLLVGNPRGKEGLEMTLSGPELCFTGPAIVALCGAPMETCLDGGEFPMWTKMKIGAGQKLKIGKTTGGGCRSYLAVYGGFPRVAEDSGSKSTSTPEAIGGYQGRALAAGDVLQTVAELPDELHAASLPEMLRPTYNSHWEIKAMVGPHDEGYFLPEDIDMIYATKWKVSHDASRSGIHLVGPAPKWARKDGGEHPSKVPEYAYPRGTLTWSGDEPCILPVDAPSSGGFVSSTTAIRAEWWKVGQMREGDTVQYVRVGLQDALKKRRAVATFLHGVERGVQYGEWGNVERIQGCHIEFHEDDIGSAVIWEKGGEGHGPRVRYRQAGDEYLVVEYGDEEGNGKQRGRVKALEKALRDTGTPGVVRDGIVDAVGCDTTLLLFYDGEKLPRRELVEHLQMLETWLGDEDEG